MLVVAFIAIVAVIGPIILGAIAFLRTTRYAKVIVALDERIKGLESLVKDGVAIREDVRTPLSAEEQAALGAPAPQLTRPGPPDPVIVSDEPLPTPEPSLAPDVGAIPEPVREPIQEPALAAREAAPEATPDTPKAPKPATGDGESKVGASWVYYLLGGAIATALVIGVGMAAGSGALGPATQALGGLLLAAGLIYGATAMPGLPNGRPDGRAALLGAAGLFCGLATAAAGHFLLSAWGASIGLAAWGVSSLAAMALGLSFGQLFAWGGLALGLAGPLLFRLPGDQSMIVGAYLLTLTGVALGLARIGGWRILSWGATAAALAWGGGLTALYGVGQAPAAALYLVGLAVLAAAQAWDSAQGPALLIGPGSRGPDRAADDNLAGWPEPLVAGHALGLGAFALLIVLFFLSGPLATPVGAALVSVAAIAITIAVVREGLSLFALTAGALALMALVFWPQSPPPEDSAQHAAIAAAGLGLFATMGGWAMMLRHTAPTTGATIAAIGPVGALLAARLRLGDLDMPVTWGLAALALAAAMSFAFWKLRAGDAQERRFAPSSAFAVGSALAAALAVGAALPGLWLAAGLAVLAPLGAMADRRFDLAGARAAIGGIAALVVTLLTVGIAPITAKVSTTPIANELVIVYVIAIVALYSAATIIGRSRGETALPEGLRFGCVALTVAFLAYSVRHLTHGGKMDAAYASAVEVGLQAAIALAAAFFLAFRYGAKPERPMLRFTEVALFGLGLSVAVGGLVLAINPAWGMTARPAANGLELAYGAPTLALAAYSALRARHGLAERAAVAGWASAGLALIWLTLTIRAATDGADLSGTPISLASHWALSIGWIAFASALGVISVVQPIAGFKQASAALFVATMVKIFVIDLSPLDLVMRVLATLFLGALAVGGAMVYQRFVFGRDVEMSPRRRIDPNLMPPS